MKFKVFLPVLVVLIMASISSFAQDPNFHIYLCFGQSNMEGNAWIESEDTVNIDERFQVMQSVDCPFLGREKGNWYTAKPPLSRCRTGLTPADYFGRTLVKKLPVSIKVGVINVSVAGCKIELFDKENFQSYAETAPGWMKNMIEEYDGNPYEYLVSMAKLAQKDGVIKGFLLHQGESNTGDALWPEKVKVVYDNLIADLGLNPDDVPLLAGELVNTDQNGKCASMNKIIAKLPEVIPNAHVVSSIGCPGKSDGLHFTAEGYRVLGQRYGELMHSLMKDSKINDMTKQVSSPDGKIMVSVLMDKTAPVYSISYDGEIFLEQSPLGMLTNVGDFAAGLILSDNVEEKQLDETYELPNIKQSKVHYVANEAVFRFSKDTIPAIDVVFRVSNQDVAFKYIVHPQGQYQSCVVKSEVSGFVFPEGTTTFLSAQSDPMVGFARTMPSYEIPYKADAPMGENGFGNGYTFPCLFKINDKGWILISETGVDSRYCGSRLIGHEGGLYTIGFPMEGENNGNGTTSPGIPLPGETPWRTITLGDNLKPIVETTVPFDLVKPRYEASQKYDYTKGTWSWIIGMDGSTVYDEQKRYIDFSAALGYETVLVDALWDTQIGRDKIEELASYGKSKGVSLYLWYNSNGYWNDAPQGPRGIMDNPISRRKEMAWMKSIGVKGIKVDFFGGDKQVTMKLYEDILYDAYDFGIMCIFHGCTLPRGWERMYPNYASSEAVLASENLHFSQERCDTEAFNACLHPFIRNTVGSMDFGGSTLNEYWNSKNSSEMWGGHRITSDVFALATAVLFQSGVQHFALAPNNLTEAPEWAINFMKNVPSTWDETRFIDGYPSRYVVLARRHGKNWYIAGINAQKEPLELKVKLPMIASGEMINLYHDNAQLEGELKSVKLRKNQEIELTIPCNGGAIIVH